jgi:hypothetical protein
LGRCGCLFHNRAAIAQIRLSNGDFLREKHPRHVKSVGDIIEKSQGKQRDAGYEKQYRDANQHTDPTPLCLILFSCFFFHHSTPFILGLAEHAILSKNDFPLFDFVEKYKETENNVLLSNVIILFHGHHDSCRL